MLIDHTTPWTQYKVGDWSFEPNNHYIHLQLFEGEAGYAMLPINCVGHQHPSWQWDGNREAPTLTPSILHHSNPPWHGYLRNGKLE